MARYIDADNLAQRIMYYMSHTPERCGEHYAYKVALKEIVGSPTADVVEVKHAEWIDRYKNKYANRLYVCSACGCKALYDFYENDLNQIESRQELTDVCPHCLAIMDGGKTE